MTGTSWGMIFYTFSELKMNPISLVVAWAEFVCLATLILVTVLKYSRKSISISKKTLYFILAGWALLVLLRIPMPWTKWMVDLKMFALYQIYTTVLAWCRIILFTILATKSVQFWRSKRLLQND